MILGIREKSTESIVAVSKTRMRTKQRYIYWLCSDKRTALYAWFKQRGLHSMVLSHILFRKDRTGFEINLEMMIEWEDWTAREVTDFWQDKSAWLICPWGPGNNEGPIVARSWSSGKDWFVEKATTSIRQSSACRYWWLGGWTFGRSIPHCEVYTSLPAVMISGSSQNPSRYTEQDCRGLALRHTSIRLPGI